MILSDDKHAAALWAAAEIGNFVICDHESFRQNSNFYRIVCDFWQKFVCL